VTPPQQDTGVTTVHFIDEKYEGGWNHKLPQRVTPTLVTPKQDAF